MLQGAFAVHEQPLGMLFQRGVAHGLEHTSLKFNVVIAAEQAGGENGQEAGHGNTHPQGELPEKLAALVPRPRLNLTRFHGVPISACGGKRRVAAPAHGPGQFLDRCAVLPSQFTLSTFRPARLAEARCESSPGLKRLP